MQSDEQAVILAFDVINSGKFAELSEEKKDVQRFLAPPVNSLEEIAKKYAFQNSNRPGKFTGADIEKTLRDAAAALNRKMGSRWSQGAIDIVAPEAASRIRKDFKNKPEKIAATYNAILAIPDAYVAFIKMEGIEQGSTLHRRQIRNAWAAQKRCGVYPFC